MSFSQEWDDCYMANTQMSIWPWSDIVSLVFRHCKSIISKKGKVLELGCGAGANIPLFRSLGLEYFSVEGSSTIVKQLHRNFPDFQDKIQRGDFSIKLPFCESFSLIIDRAAVTHNNARSIKSTLRNVFNTLEPHGIFIGSDWFSNKHTDFSLGDPIDDNQTRTNYSKGQFAGVGKVHFSDEAHLRDLFSSFEIIFMEEKLIRRCEPRDDHLFASWNIVARKPHV